MTTKLQQARRPPKKAERLPATGTKTDAPHVSRAVRGCGCPQCFGHRWYARQEAETRRLVERDADAPMDPDSVAWLEHERGGRDAQ